MGSNDAWPKLSVRTQGLGTYRPLNTGVKRTKSECVNDFPRSQHMEASEDPSFHATHCIVKVGIFLFYPA